MHVRGFRHLKTWCRATLTENRLCRLAMIHVHRNDTVGKVNPETVLKRWDSSDNRKIHLHSCIDRLSTIILNYSLKYYFRNQSVVLCLIYHRSFDGVAAIDDSNWYIKRLNNIEIEKKRKKKKALFWAVKSQFSTASDVSNH